MSRYGDEDDTCHDDPPPPNATCTDCGIAYGKADHDPTTWCDACSDHRDAHTDALEIRLAKATLPAAVTERTDVA
jgi:hypothetical protein